MVLVPAWVSHPYDSKPNSLKIEFLLRPYTPIFSSVKNTFSGYIIFFMLSKTKSKVLSKSHNFTIWQKMLLIPLWPT